MSASVQIQLRRSELFRYALLWFVLVSLVLNVMAESPRSRHRAEGNPLEEEKSFVGKGVLAIHALFPDLNPESLVLVKLSYTWEDLHLSHFEVYICDSLLSDSPLNGDRFSETCSSVALEATVLLWRGDGRTITDLTVHRSAIGNRESALASDLKRQPPKNMAELSSRLKAAGALYGPEYKKKFTAELPLKALKKVYGELRIKSVEFLPRDVEDETWDVAPEWCVIAYAGNIRLQLLFSVFDGKFYSAKPSSR